jgi:hypothetical protein
MEMWILQTVDSLLIPSSLFPSITNIMSMASTTVFETTARAFGERSFGLSPDDERYRVLQVQAFILEHGLDTSIQVEFNTTCRGLRKGSSTIKDYSYYLQNICVFSGLIGDYQTSCLFDRELCPRNPLPAVPETIALYYRWKSGKKGEALVDKNNAPVKMVASGDVVQCTGDWKSPSPLAKARAAFLNIHILYDELRGEYEHSCPECCELNPTESNVSDRRGGQWRSCSRHANKPLLVPRGNAVHARVAADVYNRVKTELHSSHTVKGSLQLNPRQIRQLRECLLNSGSLYDQQTYTIILMGIKLFLRADELLSVKIEDFQMVYAVVHDKCVRSLAVKVQGKSDARPVLLKIWKDDENPEFCLIRLLFCYLKVTGIKEGYLFPPFASLKQSMKDNSHDGKYYTGIKYCSWLARMKAIIGSTFPNEDNHTPDGCIGTHTLRKTAYLFATWGVLRKWSSSTKTKPISDIMHAQILMSARHASVGHACSYVLDACTLHMLATEERDQELQSVSPWETIHLFQTNSAYQILVNSRANQMQSIAEQADWYFQNETPLPSGCPFIQYYQAACRVKPSTSLQGQLDDVLTRGGLPQVLEGELRKLIRSMVLDAGNKANLAAPLVQDSDPFLSPVQAGVKRSCPVRGLDNLDELRTLCSSLEKPNGCKKDLYAALLEIHRVFTTRQSSLGDGARRWARFRVRAFLIMKECIAECFNGNENEYFASLPSKLAVTKHHCTCVK